MKMTHHRAAWVCWVAMIVLSVTVIHGEPAASKPAGSPLKEYRDVAAKLFELSSQNRVDEAMTQADIPRRLGRDAADALREELASINRQSWKYIDTEIAASKTLTSRLHEVFAIGHFDQGPVLLILRFYRANEGWMLLSVKMKYELNEFITDLPFDEKSR